METIRHFVKLVCTVVQAVRSGEKHVCTEDKGRNLANVLQRMLDTANGNMGGIVKFSKNRIVTKRNTKLPHTSLHDGQMTHNNLC